MASILYKVEEDGVIYRHRNTYTESGGHFISTFRVMPDCRTIYEVLTAAKVKYSDGDALGHRVKKEDGSFGPYVWISYNEFYDRITQFALGLHKLGLRKGDRVGIYSVNQPSWQIASSASQISSLIPVPIYDSLGNNAAQYIISHSECSVVVVQTEKLSTLKNVLPETPSVKYVVVMNEFEQEPIDGVEVYNFNQIYELGKQNKDAELDKPIPDDVAVLMYTSGSTGKPKGCLLTHKNVIAGGTGLVNVDLYIHTSDKFFSLLPLAHIYEFAGEMAMLGHGAGIGYTSGSVRNLMDDLAALQPTIVAGVPRIWNRVAELMKAKIAELPVPLRMLVNYALKSKQEAMRENKPYSLVLDIILSKFKAAFGGGVKLIISGGAPILPEVFDFICSVITPNIIQGYGLTEVTASVAVSLVPEHDPMSNGPISQAGEVKLRKVDGLDYDPFGDMPAGEILVRGDQVFKGYYKDDELTKEAIDKDGWFITGDIGLLTPSGNLQIVDRIKQLIKLSQGEYISITQLTDIYGFAKGVSNIYIYADSYHDHPFAVVVPTPEFIKKWADAGIKDLVSSQVVKEELMSNLDAIYQEQKLRGFEKIKDIIIDLEEFTIENNLLTPSLKPQWKNLRAKYEKSITAKF